MNHSKSQQAAGYPISNDQQGNIQSPIEKSEVLGPPTTLGYPPQPDYTQQPPSYCQQPQYHVPAEPSAPPPSYYDAGSNNVRH